MKIGSDPAQEQRLRKRLAAVVLIAVAALFAEPVLANQSSPVAPIIQQR
ncbi:MULTISPECIES: hypothetical protein [unclassified Luteococcus]